MMETEESDADSMRDAHRTFKLEVASIKEAMADMLHENDRLRDKVKELTHQLLLKENDGAANWDMNYFSLLEAKESAVAMWKEALEEIARLGEKVKLVDRYEVAIKEYEAQFQLLTRRHSEMESSKQEAEKKLHSLAKEKEGLEKVLAAKTKYIEAFDAKLQKELDAQRRKFEERLQAQVEEKSLLEGRIDELSTTVRSLEGANKQLEESQQQAQRVASDCLRKVEEATLEVAILQQQKQKATDEAQHWREAARKRETEHQEALRNTVSDLRKEAARIKEECDGKMEQIKKELREKEAELKQLRDAMSETHNPTRWQLTYRMQKAEETVLHLQKKLQEEEQRNADAEVQRQRELRTHAEKVERLERDRMEDGKRMVALEKAYHRHKAEAKAAQKKLRAKVDHLERLLQEQKSKQREAETATLQARELLREYDFVLTEMKRHTDGLVENVESEYRKLLEANRKLDHSSERAQKKLTVPEFSSRVEDLSQRLQAVLLN